VNIIPTNTSLEEPVDFDSTPNVLDASAARSKAKLMRKSSTERRLPASVLAKKKAAEKLKEILTKKDTNSGSDQSNVIEQIKNELIDASFQVDMSNPEYDLENLDDDAKADLIAKQISKMDSSYVMKLLKKIEKGILDISIPMLMPFLSLQVKLKMGTNIFKGLEPHNKKKMVKENFINDMIDDITDIALLQEVLERTQEKLNILNPPKEEEKEIEQYVNENYFNIENDSFDLPSAPVRHTSPIKEESPGIQEENADHDQLKVKCQTEEKEKTPDAEAFEEVTEIKKEKESVHEEKTENSDTDGKKSDDEGCPSSEFDSSSEEDKEETKEIQEKISDSKHKEDEDEGIGKEQETKPTEMEELDPKQGNEKVIKQRILNIIENAKSIDQKRAVRNYGRTFEFQNMQLKPVVPNDKRPAKAKRMDNMWNQTLAKKQGVQINHLPTVPKPKVPWTMKKNPQPEKKAVDKDVDEFEKCRDTLKNGTGKPSPNVGKDIKTIQKMTTAVSNNIKETIAEETKENIQIEDIKETPKCIAVENVECKETSVITKQKIEIRDTSEEMDKEKIKIGNTNETPEKVSNKQNDVIKEAILNAESLIKEKVALQTDTTKTSTARKNPSETSSSSERGSNDRKDQSPKNTSISDNLNMAEDVTTVQENMLKEKIVTKEEEPKKEDKEVPSTPIVRRRGDTFTVVLPPPKCKPPPPPMFRPPPPPMSPPVPESKVKDLEKENKLVIEVKNKKPESESESEEEEEESEWEWTEEEEEESESDSECEVKKEGWENIMSSSKGPTTFKAEYSVKLGGN